jgi:hypothetical protein
MELFRKIQAWSIASQLGLPGACLARRRGIGTEIGTKMQLSHLDLKDWRLSLK